MNTAAAPRHGVDGRLALAAVALICTVAGTAWALWDAPGTPDVDIWMEWIRALSTNGPREGYRAVASDYPPGASLLLWTVTALGGSANLDPRLSLKIFLFACLLVTTAVTLAGSRRVPVAILMYASTCVSALGLMYLDILTAPLIAGAMWAAMANMPLLMMTGLVLASLMKWQPLILLPFAAIHVLKRSRETGTKSFWSYMALASVPALLMLGVYGMPVLESLYRASRHTTLSSFAANFPWLLTWWFGRGSTARLESGGVIEIVYASRLMLRLLSLLMLIAYGTILRVYWKRGLASAGDWMRFSLLGYWAYAVISAGAHENHLFLASLLAIGLAWNNSRDWPLALALSLIANLNLIGFYGLSGYTDRLVVIGLDVTVLLAAINCAAFLGVGWGTMRAPIRNSTGRGTPVRGRNQHERDGWQPEARFDPHGQMQDQGG
jgi:hypothetical protein